MPGNFTVRTSAFQRDQNAIHRIPSYDHSTLTMKVRNIYPFLITLLLFSSSFNPYIFDYKDGELKRRYKRLRTDLHHALKRRALHM